MGVRSSWYFVKGGGLGVYRRAYGRRYCSIWDSSMYIRGLMGQGVVDFGLWSLEFAPVASSLGFC
jgi:hypothetical protein